MKIWIALGVTTVLSLVPSVGAAQSAPLDEIRAKRIEANLDCLVRRMQARSAPAPVKQKSPPQQILRTVRQKHEQPRAQADKQASDSGTDDHEPIHRTLSAAQTF